MTPNTFFKWNAVPRSLSRASGALQVCERCEAMKAEIMRRATDAKGVFQLKVGRWGWIHF